MWWGSSSRWNSLDFLVMKFVIRILLKSDTIMYFGFSLEDKQSVYPIAWSNASSKFFPSDLCSTTRFPFQNKSMNPSLLSMSFTFHSNCDTFFV